MAVMGPPCPTSPRQLTAPLPPSHGRAGPTPGPRASTTASASLPTVLGAPEHLAEGTAGLWGHPECVGFICAKVVEATSPPALRPPPLQGRHGEEAGSPHP